MKLFCHGTYFVPCHSCNNQILIKIIFQLHLTNDAAQRVRVNALHTLTICLCLVKELPRSDANVFPEYVLPSIAPLATDISVMVRVAYARNIGLFKY